MKTALKVGIPLVVVAVVVIVVISAIATPGKAKVKEKFPSAEVRAVSQRQIDDLPPASQVIEVTNRLGKPQRTEEPGLASENPQRVYLYYPVKGAEKSQLWELAFARGERRLKETGRCPVAVVLERGGDCSKPPSR